MTKVIDLGLEPPRSTHEIADKINMIFLHRGAAAPVVAAYIRPSMFDGLVTGERRKPPLVIYFEYRLLTTQ